MNRAQQILDEATRPRKRVKLEKPAAVQQVLMSPEEMDTFVTDTLEYKNFIRLLGYIEKGLYVSGAVTRTSSRYSHENTVAFELEVCDMDQFDEAQQTEIEALSNEVEKEIAEEVKTTSRKIYGALEREWDYQNSDEVVDENISANEYEFDEDGHREDGGGFTIETLPDDSAKERARDWFRQGIGDNGYWHEHTLTVWKEELEAMGWSEPEIAYSGFSSQGDGASFTARSLDFPKFAKFFMSGYAKERGHPYSDDLFKDEPPQPPVAESEELGIDMDDFTRDSVYSNFSVIGTYDPSHEAYNRPGEKHYLATKMADDKKFMVRLNMFDGMPDTDKKGYASVEIVAQGWTTVGGARRVNGNVKRKVRFYIPPGYKSKLIALLLDYWINAQGVADRRNAEGEPPDPVKMCRSLSYRLSMLSSLWKQETELEYHTHLKDTAEKWAKENPEAIAAYRKKLDDWAKKHPEPSAEKLELRHAMKQWKKERDAAAQAVPPPPQQESEDDELMGQMGDVAARAAVNSLGSVMNEQPVRYMSGSRQYNWSSSTPDWRWKITVHANVYDEQLPNQPWEVDIAVHSNQDSRDWRIDKLVVTDDEKNQFGMQMHKIIPQVRDIAERSWDEPDQLLRDLEIVFNRTMGHKQTASPGQRTSTFYSY